MPKSDKVKVVFEFKDNKRFFFEKRVFFEGSGGGMGQIKMGFRNVFGNLEKFTFDFTQALQ